MWRDRPDLRRIWLNQEPKGMVPPAGAAPEQLPNGKDLGQRPSSGKPRISIEQLAGKRSRCAEAKRQGKPCNEFKAPAKSGAGAEGGEPTA